MLLTKKTSTIISQQKVRTQHESNYSEAIVDVAKWAALGLPTAPHVRAALNHEGVLLTPANAQVSVFVIDGLMLFVGLMLFIGLMLFAGLMLFSSSGMSSRMFLLSIRSCLVA